MIQTKKSDNPRIKAELHPVSEKDEALFIQDLRREAVSALDRLIKKRRQKLAAQIISLRKRAYKRTSERVTAFFKDQLMLKTTELQSSYEEVLSTTESQCLNLVLKICSNILQTEIATSPEVIKNLIRQGLKAVFDTNRLELTTSIGEETVAKEYIKAHYPELSVKITASKDIQPGELTISNSSGHLHLSWKTQLQKLATHYHQALQEK